MVISYNDYIITMILSWVTLYFCVTGLL